MTARQSAEVADGWVWDGVIGLNYARAAYVLGVPAGWLEEKVPKKEIPHGRLGKHVVFYPEHIAEIRRMHHQPALVSPPATVAADVVTDPAVVRAALMRAKAA